MFRVIVDGDSCEANAFCTGFAPDVFELGAEAPPVTVRLAEVGEEHRVAVEQAVRGCPRLAIRLEELG